MGFTTHFWGQVGVDPALDNATRRRLIDWNARDHLDASTPGIWCGWVPTEDGRALIWDGQEKFYEAAEWMKYLIDRFIAGQHTATGVVFAEAEPEGMGYFDTWRMDVVDNIVSVTRYEVPVLEFDDEQEELVEEIDLVDAITMFSVKPTVAVKMLEQHLRVIQIELEQPDVARALARFLQDVASVFAEPDRLRRAVAPFVRLAGPRG